MGADGQKRDVLSTRRLLETRDEKAGRRNSNRLLAKRVLCCVRFALASHVLEIPEMPRPLELVPGSHT